MKIRVTGPTKQAQRLANSIQHLGSGKGKTEINARASEVVYSLVQDNFQNSTDPDGNAWEPLKFREGDPLVDTGGLRDSIDVTSVTSDSFEMGTDWEYAHVHQDGMTITGPGSFPGYDFVQKTNRRFRYNSVTIPSRQMVPENEFSEEWMKQIEEGLAELLSGKLGVK
jgi:phage gpG-like protein